MNLDLVKIAKDNFKEKEILLENLPNNKVKVFYGSEHVTTLKPFVFPKFLNLDKRFSELIGLYLGDGNFMSKDERHTIFTTTDKDIAKTFLNHLIEIFVIDVNFLHIYGYFSSGDRKSLTHHWSRYLEIPNSKINFRKREGNRKETVEIHISNKIFRITFKKIISIVLVEIKKNSNLRKAFLRGYFAADGSIETRQNKGHKQINHISFAYHKTKEIWLQDFISDCLKLEDIRKFSIKLQKDKESASIRVARWQYFVKFWEMRLFDLCERKKNKFLETIRTANFYLKLDQRFHKTIFANLNKTQKEISKILNCKSEGEICDTIHQKHLLRVEQISNLLVSNSFSWEDVINHSVYLRVGQRGNLQLNKKFLRFVLSEKHLI